MAANNDAQIWGVMAASGSGKGLWIKAFLAREKPARLVVWDYKNEYEEHAPPLVSSLEALRLAMKKAGSGGLRIRYKCKPGTNVKQTMAEFEGVCRLVQAWKKCTFIAEELSNVTTPGWAPAAWREMSTGGRHEQVHIIGVAQNPALIDKTFLSNCTLIHVGPLREFRHRQAVARSMDIPVQMVTDLVQFQWVERDHNNRELREGWTYPPGFKPENAKTAPAKAPEIAPRRREPSGSATGTAKGGQAKGGRVKSPPSKPATNQPNRSNPK
jgi:hypothetical protein